MLTVHDRHLELTKSVRGSIVHVFLHSYDLSHPRTIELKVGITYHQGIRRLCLPFFHKKTLNPILKYVTMGCTDAKINPIGILGLVQKIWLKLLHIFE